MCLCLIRGTVPRSTVHFCVYFTIIKNLEIGLTVPLNFYALLMRQMGGRSWSCAYHSLIYVQL